MKAWPWVLLTGSTLPPAAQKVDFGGQATALTAADCRIVAARSPSASEHLPFRCPAQADRTRHKGPTAAGQQAGVALRACCQPGWEKGSVTVMLSGNQRAPLACSGAPQTVCRYRIGAPKPPRVSLAGKP
jgi:hypothetical protein